MSTEIVLCVKLVPPYPQPRVEKNEKKCLALRKWTGNVFMQLR
jgi:hypothetical protein